jgi:hypothetical protein
MKFTLCIHTFSSALLLAAAGCDRGPAGPTRPVGGPASTRPPVDRNVEVNTGPGGVDVEVNRDRPGTGKKIDVDVKPGGGVDVNVDRDAIRQSIDERRAERARE